MQDISVPYSCPRLYSARKNGFVTATKLGTTNKIFVAAAKNFAAATKRFVDRTKHFVVLTKFFVIPILTNDFVGITKPFFPCGGRECTISKDFPHFSLPCFPNDEKYPQKRVVKCDVCQQAIQVWLVWLLLHLKYLRCPFTYCLRKQLRLPV